MRLTKLRLTLFTKFKKSYIWEVSHKGKFSRRLTNKPGGVKQMYLIQYWLCPAFKKNLGYRKPNTL